MRSDYAACLRTVNDLLSRIPPYELYMSHRLLRSSRESKSIYEHVYLQSDADKVERIRTSWLQDLRFYKHMLYKINLPLAVCVELSICDTVGVVVGFFFNFNALAFENIPPTKSGYPGNNRTVEDDVMKTGLVTDDAKKNRLDAQRSWTSKSDGWANVKIPRPTTRSQQVNRWSITDIVLSEIRFRMNYEDSL